jgi:hypothetical protein
MSAAEPDVERGTPPRRHLPALRGGGEDHPIEHRRRHQAWAVRHQGEG